MPKLVKEIIKDFDGKLIGNYHLKLCVCKTLVKMPDEIIEFITSNCWFLGSMDDAWAFTFTGNDLKNMHLIFLSDELLSQNQQQIEFSIAHEIGHVRLGHKNSVLKRQSKEEVRLQEKEADRFAREHGF